MQESIFPEEIHRSASFSEDRRYRYWLRRDWGDMSRTVCWIGFNPSDADEKKDDPTIRRCIQFSKRWGYGSMMMVNIIPVVSSSPATANTWASAAMSGNDWPSRDIIRNYAEQVVEIASKSSLVIACWGNMCREPGVIDYLDMRLDEEGVKLYQLGTNKDGTPRHPMARGARRIPDDALPTMVAL